MINTSQEKIVSMLLKNNIFSSASEKEIDLILKEHSYINNYKKGEVIFSKETYEKSIGFIIKGSAKVIKDYVTISRLSSGELFGTVLLYNKADFFVNNIIAEDNSKILFIKKEGVDELIAKNSDFAKKYIEYLSSRIYFLNNKIEEFTIPSAEEKLYNYILKNANDGVFTVQRNMTELAKSLNISRASLYRTLDDLILDGKVIKEDKKIILI
ncbi:MAG: Crp/Fnr family transcriptional regulator [Oscillospiraceae bacterium]